VPDGHRLLWPQADGRRVRSLEGSELYAYHRCDGDGEWSGGAKERHILGIIKTGILACVHATRIYLMKGHETMDGLTDGLMDGVC